MEIKQIEYKWAYGLSQRGQTSHLILHHAAGSGSAEAIHSYHLSLGWAGIAYHYYVRRDGSIYAGRPEKMRGGHTTDWNWCSIGICFEGNFDSEEMSEAQIRAGAGLVADIVSRYPSIEVGRHSRYGTTNCPGKNFLYDEIVSGFSKEPETDVEDTCEPDKWAKEACDWAVEAGLFQGDGCGFRWKEPVTRQELALVLQRGAK